MRDRVVNPEADNFVDRGAPAAIPKNRQPIFMVLIGLMVGVAFGIVLVVMPQPESSARSSKAQRPKSTVKWSWFKRKRNQIDYPNRPEIKIKRWKFSNELPGASMSDYKSL